MAMTNAKDCLTPYRWKVKRSRTRHYACAWDRSRQIRTGRSSSDVELRYAEARHSLEIWPSRRRSHREEDSLERSFRDHVERWKTETLHSSSLTRMIAHPSYLRITGMGPRILPLLLQELKDSPDHWLVALNAITGEDPASPGSTFNEAVEAWLAWGSERGYLE